MQINMYILQILFINNFTYTFYTYVYKDIFTYTFYTEKFDIYIFTDSFYISILHIHFTYTLNENIYRYILRVP